MKHLELFAIKISQPLCDFFITSMKASDLLQLTFSEELQYRNENAILTGSQRKIDPTRIKEISKYIDSVELSFPNTIILAANYNEKGVLINDKNLRWRFEKIDNNLYKILIPTTAKLAAIIDGQHRLKGFNQEYISKKERFQIDLPCSIFFDLPNSYQAFLFATINGNQKKVDKSLALEQFGFNVSDEPEKSWTPEKLAVFFTRKLNFKESPLSGHIKIAPKISPELQLEIFGVEKEWTVSTATVVEGILNLITSNAKRDRVEMAQENIWGKRTRKMVEHFKNDNSPLRSYYLKEEDDLIYGIIINYLNSVREILWGNFDIHSYIFKTVGIQALFDILKMILISEKSTKPLEIDFEKYLLKTSSIDFSDKFFQASGIGRSRIKNIIGINIGLIKKEKIKKRDLPIYEEILSGVKTNIEPEKMQWDEDAENAVVNTLEQVEWNYEDKSISIYLNGDYENPKIIDNYNSFFYKLVEIAENAFNSSLPGDSDFSEFQKEKFDSEDLVNSCLSDYQENLKKLAWL